MTGLGEEQGSAPVYREDGDLPEKKVIAWLKARWTRTFYLAVLIVLLSSTSLAWLDGTGRWLPGWVAYSLLGSIGIASIFGIQRLTGAYPIGKVALIAYGVRLAIGVTLFLIFPTAGYQNPDSTATQAGYTFEDAFQRDRQAWSLASSGEALSGAFSGRYSGDQYGGTLALSAAAYRYLSPDAHRPFLILFLNAMVAAWGVLLTWKGVENWFGATAAGAAAWIFALYPEGLLLGGSHMREPFVMTAVAITFYSLTILWNKKWSWVAWMLLGGAALFLLQPPVALFAFVLLSGAWLLDPHRQPSWKHMAVLAGILLLAVVLVTSVWASLPSLEASQPSNIFYAWLKNNFDYQSHLTERASGIFQKLLRDAGESWKLPIVLAYGVAQPVLPAALGDKPEVRLIWRIINILRAAGWYTLALFLVYGFLSALRAVSLPRRWQLIWLFLTAWIWFFLAAANAGADQWDNPRYRTILLTWLALLAAWAWWWARQRRDPWLGRWLMVEAGFVAIFTLWYIGRNYISAMHMGIWSAIAYTLILSAAILIGGFVWDRRVKP